MSNEIDAAATAAEWRRTRDRAWRAARRAAGRCVRCGEPAAPGRDGEPSSRCAPCAAHAEAQRRERRAAAREAGRCTACKRERTDDAAAATATLCGRCAAQYCRYAAFYRQRDRDAATGKANTPAFPLGRAATRLDGRAYTMQFMLDEQTYRAFRELKRLDDQQFEGTGQPWQARCYRTSRLTRAAILRWETMFDPVPTRSEQTGPFPHRLRVVLDSRTRLVLNWHAAGQFNGNMSATVRAMLCSAAGLEPVVGHPDVVIEHLIGAPPATTTFSRLIPTPCGDTGESLPMLW